MADFFDRAAEDASENEDVDENGEEVDRRPNGANGNEEGFDDSSEEEDDDDDEEARRAVEEGFIDDEDEDDHAGAAREKRIRRKRKRREERDEEGLDEDDLDLIGKGTQEAPQETKLKRLKRGHRIEESDRQTGLRDIFADDYDEEDNEAPAPGFASRTALAGEFDDFIEQDDEANEEGGEDDDEREVRIGPRRNKGLDALNGIDTGLDEITLEDMRAAFGDGTEYNWALDAQEDEDDDIENEKGVELKDVFEPSQLKERMLTDEDNAIRNADIPERFQLARQPFPIEELSEETQSARLTEESNWISTLLWPKKRFPSPELLDPFRKSIRQVLSYLNVDNLEVPFIFQHRKDYLIHSVRERADSDPDDPDRPGEVTNAEKLLNQSDLWEVFELDLKYRALIQRRQALQTLYDQVKEARSTSDAIVEGTLTAANSMDEVQDLQDYLNFQYASEVRDLTVRDVVNGQKRSRAGASIFERVRASPAYNVVRGFGVNPDSFARSIIEENRGSLTEDSEDRPDDLADKSTDDINFQTGSQVLRAAKQTFVEELTTCPRMRKVLRDAYYMGGRFDCYRTSKGLRQIDEDHPNYDFMYLRNQDLASIARKPELFLRMLKAEADGLVDLTLRLEDKDRFRRRLEQYIQSDNLSEVADDWNRLRKDALAETVEKLSKVMVRSVKENLKAECENQLARKCRDEYSQRLDQAPYRPKGTEPGTSARVLALTNGHGIDRGRATIHWSVVDPGGRSVEHGIWTDLRLGNEDKTVANGADVAAFISLVEKRRPDVIGVSGFTPDTRSLYKDLQAIIDHYKLELQWDDEDGTQLSERHEVIMINDEVARLYHNSDRARQEHPHFPPLTAYCVALARFVQGPIKEYAMLGRDILSISFDPDQGLIPQDKLLKHLETAIIDMVNITGVEINEAVEDSYTANLVQYVCGLGPRKGQAMLQAINRMPGGKVKSREALIGDPDQGIVQAVSPHVFFNCASFLSIDFDSSDPESNYLDSTRIHPEDYELATKMAADALDLDEEDIAAEKAENGEWAVLRTLVRDEQQEKVNDLMLELYAEQLEANFQQRKRATLETIRAELQEPYEELRNDFVILSSDEVFTMLTGETRDSLCEQMIIPVTIRKVFQDHLEVRLDCGIEGGISESEYPSTVGPPNGLDARQAFKNHQTMQAKLTFLNRKQLTAQLSLREENLRRPYRREQDREPGEWDHTQEDQDRRDALKLKEEASGRAQRVVKHPLFRPFNAAQAEEFLGPQGLGDLVIRPSSKGLDHLTVTWKVSDNVFQHIDVLELDKENEFSVGRVLRIGGRYTYTDLDELIDSHVQAMAKKVREIKNDERFQDGSKSAAENWLTSYMEANPKRAMYAFCINSQYPGYFHLCFKQSPKASIVTWPVKVIPNAFEMQKYQYPDMGALRNGFKTILMHQQQSNGRR